MTFLPGQFSKDDVEVTANSKPFQGFFHVVSYTLRHRLFKGGWSQEISREVFQRGEAAAAILFDPKNDLIGLIEQFRVGALNSDMGPWCLETVAGMIEAGETPEELIGRELAEEAGIENAVLEHISSYYSTPGGCSEKIYLYCALADLSEAEGVFGLEDEHEDIRLHVLPSAEVFPNTLTSRTNNAATIIALQWLQQHRERLMRAAACE